MKENSKMDLPRKYQFAMMLFCLEKRRDSFMLSYSIYYRWLDQLLNDYWSWLADPDEIGHYVHYDGDAFGWEKITQTYRSSSYFYYNYTLDSYAICDFFGPNIDDNFAKDICILQNVAFFGPRLVASYDYKIRNVASSFASDIIEVNEEQLFTETLALFVNVSSNSDEELLWQQKALEKLLKHHHIDQAGEWSPPITKVFFDDILI